MERLHLTASQVETAICLYLREIHGVPFDRVQSVVMNLGHDWQDYPVYVLVNPKDKPDAHA